jgi:hypothetical protein
MLDASGFSVVAVTANGRAMAGAIGDARVEVVPVE